MDRITDAFNCARITHHRPGSILVVVPLDIAAVQDVAISACAFNDEDGNDKSSNGEKNHRYDREEGSVLTNGRPRRRPPAFLQK
jgi:hypothetical protein